MAAAPAGVASLSDVHEAFFLAGEISVVVHAKKIAEVVEGDLLDVAQAVSEDLEATAIRLAAHDTAFVRVEPLFAFFAGLAFSNAFVSSLRLGLFDLIRVFPAGTNGFSGCLTADGGTLFLPSASKAAEKPIIEGISPRFKLGCGWIVNSPFEGDIAAKSAAS
jgi:hypothetical protein